MDGTKLRANASRHKAMSYERMQRKEQQLEAEIAELRRNVQALLSEAERVDAEEDRALRAERRGDELPEELQRRESRLAKIKEAKEALEARGAGGGDRASCRAGGRGQEASHAAEWS